MSLYRTGAEQKAKVEGVPNNMREGREAREREEAPHKEVKVEVLFMH